MQNKNRIEMKKKKNVILYATFSNEKLFSIATKKRKKKKRKKKDEI